MKTTKLLLCAVSIAAAVVATRAHSQDLSVTYKDPGVSPGLGIVGTINGNSFAEPGFPSGVMNFTDGPGDGVIPDFQAFCVEPQEFLGYGTSLVYTVTTPLLANSDAIARLIGGYLSGEQSPDNAAAVQWAIWEVTNETSGTYSLTDGDGSVFIATTDDKYAVLANNYLANVANYTPVALTYLTNDGEQNVVTWNLVPEPGSAALALLSAVGLIGRRRRR